MFGILMYLERNYTGQASLAPCFDKETAAEE